MNWRFIMKQHWELKSHTVLEIEGCESDSDKVKKI